MGEMITDHITTDLNPADLATKVVPGGIKRNSLIEQVLYNVV